MNKEALDFTMDFVSTSEKWKEQFTAKWQEVLGNFIVEPYEFGATTQSTTPYRDRGSRYGIHEGIVLKDPETHKVIMTYASKLMNALFSNRDGEYVQAVPVGWEDAVGRAQTTTRLLRYAFGLPGHYRSFVEAIIDMLLFGTSVVEVGWKYEEREMPMRSMSSVMGVETDEVQRLRVPVYDDVFITPLDPFDCYPDPAEYRMENMSGFAKRFRITAAKARAMAQSGIYDARAVEEAIRYAPSTKRDPNRRVDQPDPSDVSHFKGMVGYEFWGEVPWVDDQGSNRRVITVINTVLVRDDPYPFADPMLPFHALTINPVNGRFYGISPAEVIKYDQDFADALKMLVAEAAVRQVHPPIAYDPESEIDVNKLRKWKADLPIPVRGGPSSIGTLRYEANIGNAFGVQQLLTNSMQGASGAQGGIQGEPGPDREAATVGTMRIQAAMDRPELAAKVMENDALPRIGQAILRRYQQFLTGTDELAARIGELPQGVWLGDIMAQYDIRFVGSRTAMTKQEKLQAYDRLGAMSAGIPELRMLVPWLAIGQDIVGRTLDLPEVAMKMPDPQEVMRNMAISQMSGGKAGANGAGTVSQFAPPGLMPAQVSGEGPSAV